MCCKLTEAQEGQNGKGISYSFLLLRTLPEQGMNRPSYLGKKNKEVFPFIKTIHLGTDLLCSPGFHQGKRVEKILSYTPVIHKNVLL